MLFIEVWKKLASNRSAPLLTSVQTTETSGSTSISRTMAAMYIGASLLEPGQACCAMPLSARSLMKSVKRATKVASICKLNGGFMNCSRLRTNTLH